MKKLISLTSMAVMISLLSGCIIEHDRGRSTGWGHDRGWHHGHYGHRHG
ncbi:MAG: hypothetical protein K0S95_2826 [Pantoea eucrina]|jgi:hypothetical protein|nr:hypothetical protein [Pantoea eucrina]